MREIKFRCWAVASKKMFYPYSDDGWEIKNGKLYQLPNTVIMQYTGLKDKYGKKIFEGDIVKTNSTSFGDKLFKIKFIDGAFCIGNGKPKDMDNNYVTIRDVMFQAFCRNITLEIEVVGNLYENSELLNEK